MTCNEMIVRERIPFSECWPDGDVFQLPGGYVDNGGTVHREVELGPLTGADEEHLAVLNAAAETDQSVRGSYESPRPGARRPSLSRGTSSGYTGAYREPVDEDVQEVVAVQTARGPE